MFSKLLITLQNNIEPKFKVLKYNVYELRKFPKHCPNYVYCPRLAKKIETLCLCVNSKVKKFLNFFWKDVKIKNCVIH